MLTGLTSAILQVGDRQWPAIFAPGGIATFNFNDVTIAQGSPVSVWFGADTRNVPDHAVLLIRIDSMRSTGTASGEVITQTGLDMVGTVVVE